MTGNAPVLLVAAAKVVADGEAVNVRERFRTPGRTGEAEAVKVRRTTLPHTMEAS